MSSAVKGSIEEAVKAGGIVPHNNDVLCGRGGYINNHIGNENYRIFVNRKKRVYLTARFKREKRLIAASIVDEIRALDPPGRFLAKDGRTRAWYDIGDQKARDKTSQALREGAPEIRKEMESDLRKQLTESQKKLTSDDEEEEVDKRDNLTPLVNNLTRGDNEKPSPKHNLPPRKPEPGVLAEAAYALSEERAKQESMQMAVARMNICDEDPWQRQQQQKPQQDQSPPFHRNPGHPAYNHIKGQPRFVKSSSQNQLMPAYHKNQPQTQYGNNPDQHNLQHNYKHEPVSQAISDMEMEQVQENNSNWYPNGTTPSHLSPHHLHQQGGTLSPDSHTSINAQRRFSAPAQHDHTSPSLLPTEHHTSPHYYGQLPLQYQRAQFRKHQKEHSLVHHKTGENGHCSPVVATSLANLPDYHPINKSVSRESSILDGPFDSNNDSLEPYPYDGHSLPSSDYTGKNGFHDNRPHHHNHQGHHHRRPVQTWSSSDEKNMARGSRSDKDYHHHKSSKKYHRSSSRSTKHHQHNGSNHALGESRHTRPPSPAVSNHAHNMNVATTNNTGYSAVMNERIDIRLHQTRNNRALTSSKNKQIVESRNDPQDWFCSALTEWPMFSDDATFCGMDLCSVGSLGGASLCGVFAIEDDPNKNTEIEIAGKNQVLREAKSWGSIKSRSSLGSIGSGDRSMFSISSADKSLMSKGSDKGLMNSISESQFEPLPHDVPDNLSFVWTWDGKKDERRAE